MRITDIQILLSEIMSIEGYSLIKIPVVQNILRLFTLLSCDNCRDS